MPHVPELVPKKHAFNILFGQRPLTKFYDYRSAIKVELIKHDDPVAMMAGTYNFAKATWSLDGQEYERASAEQVQDAMDQMLSGKALGLGLETVNFMFRISGITRIDTHQIVRQRIGVTFSQQCSGDQFWNHQNCLVEPCIGADPALYEGFIRSTLEAKMFYARATNSQQVSIQAARSILPHNLETFIFMNTNLMTLLFFHQKRIDDGSQTWQINSIANQMAREVVKVFPKLKEVFEKNKTKFKFQVEASKDRSNMFSTGLYRPDPDTFDYNDRDFLYPATKTEMHLNKDRVKTRRFWGMKEVTGAQFIIIQSMYDQLNEEVKYLHGISNNDIKDKAIEINKRIEDYINGDLI